MVGAIQRAHSMPRTLVSIRRYPRNLLKQRAVYYFESDSEDEDDDTVQFFDVEFYDPPQEDVEEARKKVQEWLSEQPKVLGKDIGKLECDVCCSESERNAYIACSKCGQHVHEECVKRHGRAECMYCRGGMKGF